jgi:hypothetical protein
MIAFDESFFCVRTAFEQTWLSRDETPETRDRHMISSDNFMAMIIWNSDGLHRIAVLLKGQKFDTDFYCSSLLTMLSKITREFRNGICRNGSFMRTRPVLIPQSQGLNYGLNRPEGHPVTSPFTRPGTVQLFSFRLHQG